MFLSLVTVKFSFSLTVFLFNKFSLAASNSFILVWEAIVKSVNAWFSPEVIPKGLDLFMFAATSAALRAVVKLKLYQLPQEHYQEWLLTLFRKKDIELEYIKKDIINNNKWKLQ